jgi:hypothetical protein
MLIYLVDSIFLFIWQFLLCTVFNEECRNKSWKNERQRMNGIQPFKKACSHNFLFTTYGNWTLFCDMCGNGTSLEDEMVGWHNGFQSECYEHQVLILELAIKTSRVCVQGRGVGSWCLEWPGQGSGSLPPLGQCICNSWYAVTRGHRPQVKLPPVALKALHCCSLHPCSLTPCTAYCWRAHMLLRCWVRCFDAVASSVQT